MNPHDDIINELLDDDALDPKKLFDKKEYNTLIINREGFNKKDNETADLLERLVDPNNTRTENEEIFLKLKESNAQELLIEAIKSADGVEEKILLTAACWECGLDFSKDLLFFAELACNNDFRLAMEAFTVIEYSDGANDEATLKNALRIANQSPNKQSTIVNDLTELIKSRLTDQ